MKLFKFKQEVPFGESLSIAVKAEDYNEAKILIKNFMIEKTKIPEDVYHKEFTKNKVYIIERIEHYKKMLKEKPEHTTFFNSRFNDKYMYIEKENKSFSISDFLRDEALYEKFAEQKARDTYLWYFENKEYELKEVEEDKKGIVNYSFK